MRAFIRLVLVLALSSAFAAAAELRDVVAACESFRYREALALLDKLAGPESAEALRYRGIALSKMGRNAEAVDTLERAAALAPDNVDLLIDLAGAQGQLALAAGPLGKFTGARKIRAHLERAVALAPANIDARDGLFGFYLNVPGIAGGGRDKALAQLAEIERLDAAHGKIGRAEIAFVDKDYPRALALYREAQRAHPTEYRAFYGFGRIAAVSGLEPDEGLASLRQCLSLRAPLRTPGTPGVHLRIGNILQLRGDLRGARAAYEESLRIFPEYPFAKEALAKLGSR